MNIIRSTDDQCEVEYHIFNNSSELADAPRLEAAEYDFQIFQIGLRSVVSSGIQQRIAHDDARTRRSLQRVISMYLMSLETGLKWNTPPMDSKLLCLI